MFDSVLVANRGEIAVRVTRTLRSLGVRSVAVYSDADAGARHVAEADYALRLAGGYLDIEAVVTAALESGAQAIHPGYGFLSENASLARRCSSAGVTFVGPPAAAIEVMGDKINAKQAVAAAGVAVVPGRDQAGLSDAELAAAALDIGLPVLLKPSAGGGGKGMRRVDSPEQLAGEIAAARREAKGAFGDETLLVERYLSAPRHVEIQVMADSFGNVIHLGERECSLQRRHQKIIEESPCLLLDARTRQRMGEAAIAVAKAVGYVGAGTVEFIMSAERPDEFYFMEMNTRLQVEHPVTEMVSGLDLVELQLRVAAGEALALTQDQLRCGGHALEARIYAEDPAQGFLPSAGTVVVLRQPARPYVRVDSGLREGTVVGTAYDPMLAKVVAWGSKRAEALRRLDAALRDSLVLGVTTNVGWLRDLLADPDVVAGRIDTELVDRRVGAPGGLAGTAGAPGVADAAVAGALYRLLSAEPLGPVVDPWDLPGGWRLGDPSESLYRFVVSGEEIEVRVNGRASGASVRVGDGPVIEASIRWERGDLMLSVEGSARRWACAVAGEELWLGCDGRAWVLHEEHGFEVSGHAATGGAGLLRSPMPGTVVSVDVKVGDRVSAGQVLVTVEAMKMEHAVVSRAEGTVTEVSVHQGQRVKLDQPLATVIAGEEAARS